MGEGEGGGGPKNGYEHGERQTEAEVETGG